MPRTDQGEKVVYCVVPADLAHQLHEPLRDHFRGERGVEVIVERREGDRRSEEDRRQRSQPVAAERRAPRLKRRGAERRAPAGCAAVPDLPDIALPFARRLRFVERFQRPLEVEDIDSQRLVAAFQAGRHDAFAELYMRYFERVYNYMRVLVRDEHEAEEGTQQVFLNVFTALPRYRQRREPFRAWLFIIARNEAISILRKQGRLQVTDPMVLAAERDQPDPSPHGLNALRWVTERELVMLIERLPVPQRQALMLRYMLDLEHADIARIMERTPQDVRMLLHRGQRFLRDRLVALGRRSENGRRPQPMRRKPAHAFVLRRRRFALMR